MLVPSEQHPSLHLSPHPAETTSPAPQQSPPAQRKVPLESAYMDAFREQRENRKYDVKIIP